MKFRKSYPKKSFPEILWRNIFRKEQSLRVGACRLRLRGNPKRNVLDGWKNRYRNDTSFWCGVEE